MSGAYNQPHKCECGEKKGVKRRKTNAMYQDEWRNYITTCERCYNEYCAQMAQDLEEHAWLTRP